MGRSRRGRHFTIGIGIVVAALLAGVAAILWPGLRAAYVPWRDFDPVGKNAQGYMEYRHRGTGITFVKLPGGDFRMGSSPEEVEAGLRLYLEEQGPRTRTIVEEFLSREAPRHRVRLRPFLIAKYEVTQAEWRKSMETEPWGADWRADDLPAHGISARDCEEFCRETGLALPTEAQWEYACRAGTRGNFAGPIDELGWYEGNTTGPCPVGWKPPNGFGIHDMHGNVGEWCKDTFDPEFYSSPGATRPEPLSTSGEARAMRGGFFNNGAFLCRSASRLSWTETVRGPWSGFRPVYNLYSR